MSLGLRGTDAFSGELALTVTNIDRPGTLFVTVYHDVAAFVDEFFYRLNGSALVFRVRASGVKATSARRIDWRGNVSGQ